MLTTWRRMSEFVTDHEEGRQYVFAVVGTPDQIALSPPVGAMAWRETGDALAQDIPLLRTTQYIALRYSLQARQPFVDLSTASTTLQGAEAASAEANKAMPTLARDNPVVRIGCFRIVEELPVDALTPVGQPPEDRD